MVAKNTAAVVDGPHAVEIGTKSYQLGTECQWHPFHAPTVLEMVTSDTLVIHCQGLRHSRQSVLSPLKHVSIKLSGRHPLTFPIDRLSYTKVNDSECSFVHSSSNSS